MNVCKCLFLYFINSSRYSKFTHCCKIMNCSWLSSIEHEQLGQRWSFLAKRRFQSYSVHSFRRKDPVFLLSWPTDQLKLYKIVADISWIRWKTKLLKTKTVDFSIKDKQFSSNHFNKSHIILSLLTEEGVAAAAAMMMMICMTPCCCAALLCFALLPGPDRWGPIDKPQKALV